MTKKAYDKLIWHSTLTEKCLSPLKDMSNFRSVHLNSDLDTIAWKNGADVSPDFLYEIGVPVAESVPAA